ncbi:MAG TPA: serpin family protein [Myxococcales bacterium]|jgi:serpin B|nr:serpin family protein [Myxococcales bacterium]
MSPAAPPLPPDFAVEDHAFAADLYKAARPPSGNLFLSPASVRIALAMTAAGALGGTEEEMQRVLRLSESTQQNNAAMQALLSALNAPGKEYELHVVDRLWAQAGASIKPAFSKTLETSFHSPLEQLDFEHALEASRLKINQWVKEQTAGKIDDLIRQGILKPDARLVLTNAIYFKAKWTHQFNPRSTADAEFFGAAKTAQVKTMRMIERFGYAEVPGAKLLELPYADGALSMVIALPNANDGLAALEKSLDGKTLDRWIAALQSGNRVSVSLPKFKLESSFTLSETLKAMGMKSAFVFGPADFSGIDGTRDFFIGEVVHKAFIDLDERGTEAAAATAVMMRAGSAMMRQPDPKEFKADHPFFFFIRDLASGAVLFTGRVADL